MKIYFKSSSNLPRQIYKKNSLYSTKNNFRQKTPQNQTDFLFLWQI